MYARLFDAVQYITIQHYVHNKYDMIINAITSYDIYTFFIACSLDSYFVESFRPEGLYGPAQML